MLLLFGLFLISYSTVAIYISNISQTYVVNEYDSNVSSLKKSEISSIKEKANSFNNSLTDNVSTSNSERKTEYAFSVGEIEGYITIPKIRVVLPIYEGTRETILNKGVGHISSTSLPIGGKSTHCVLTGHSAYPTSTLFNDLDLLKVGDLFYIKCLDEVYTYKIDKIMIKEKSVADRYIKIQKNKDYCSLITCTPKTVNSHRLIVRGERVIGENKASVNKIINTVIADKENGQRIVFFIVLSLALVILIIIIMLIRKKLKRRDDNASEKNKAIN